ncbi:MAG: hypothetical protein QW175_02535 [Candidatus Bathyarchaeia archaeon]
MYLGRFPNDLSNFVWSLNSFIAALSVLLGAIFGSRTQKRANFILAWIFLGMLSSFSPALVDIHSLSGAIITSIMFSIAFGVGLAPCMAIFAENTPLEKRGKIAGITLFFIMGAGGLLSGLMTEDIFRDSVILTTWRALCFVPWYYIYKKQHYRCEEWAKDKKSGFISILRNNSFLLYMVPWTMLLLINHLFISVGTEICGEVIYTYILVENILVGIFAIIGGFICDIIGRKRLSMIGFVVLGLGYAILGLHPFNPMCWYIYIVIDGIAWGVLYVIFLFTVWGDISSGKACEKYYALASLPYILSNFIRFTFGPIIAASLSAYAIFSFAALFLFLAVIPLMFAPETLPERVIRERELRSYIERAKRVRERFTKG